MFNVVRQCFCYFSQYIFTSSQPVLRLLSIFMHVSENCPAWVSHTSAKSQTAVKAIRPRLKKVPWPASRCITRRFMQLQLPRAAPMASRKPPNWRGHGYLVGPPPRNMRLGPRCTHCGNSQQTFPITNFQASCCNAATATWNLPSYNFIQTLRRLMRLNSWKG